MQLFVGEYGVIIDSDKNVTKYATDDYMGADLTGYDSSSLNVKELRALYNEAQNVFYRLRAKKVPLEECYAERQRLANQYDKYKALFLAACEGKRFKVKAIPNDIFTI